MPRNRLDEFRVGIFISVGLVLAMVVIFMIGSDSELFQRKYVLFSNFKTVSGLRVGAPVQLAGFKVGHVDKISFPDDPASQEITVRLSLNKEYQSRIRTDSVATIETQGLLGDKFVYVSVGSEAQSVIPDRGILPSKDVTSIFSLAEKAGTILDDISGASKSINDMISSLTPQGGGDIKAIISSVRKTVEQVEKGNSLVHALVYDPKGEDVISNLSAAMKSVKGILAGAEEESKGNIGGLIANMRAASADLKIILDAVRRGEGTVGRLVMDPSLYDEMRSLFGKANRNRLLRAVVRTTMTENDKRELK